MTTIPHPKKGCTDNSIEKPVICLQDVAVAYQSNVAIFDINLDIYKNEFFGLVGPNGSGKSTLLKAIVGAEKPFQGFVRIFGKDINKQDARPMRLKIGYLPQQEPIDRNFPALVKDIVAMGLYPKLGFFKWPGQKEEEKIQRALEIVELEDYIKRPIGHLSGGQQQKARIARAMVDNPEILLLDEPFSALDFKVAQNLADLIKKIHEKHDITIVMISHSINVLKKYATRVACIDRRILWQGSPQADEFDQIVHDIFLQ
jgi:ABC-type Mn2+/Zn2+ transport system ATPase subunit